MLIVYPNDLRLSMLFITAINNCNHSLSKAKESLSCDRIRISCSRSTVISTLTDTLNQWNLSQQRHTHLLSQILAAILSEDIILVIRKLCRSKVSHILNKSQHRNIHLVICIHINAFDSIGKSHLLRRADNDCSGNRNSLEKRQMELVRKLFPNGESVNATRLVVRALELRILDIDNLEPDME